MSYVANMVRFGKKHGQIWQKVVLVSTMFSKTMESANVSIEQKKFFGSQILEYKQQNLILGFPEFDQLEPHPSWGEVSDGPIRKQ